MEHFRYAVSQLKPALFFRMGWNVVEALQFLISADASANTHLDSSHVLLLDGPYAVNTVSNCGLKQSH